MNLSTYLHNRSLQICADNHCTEDEHFCESYAYVTAEGKLLDICCPDYFQGSSRPYAAIPLPWNGTEEELKRKIRREIAEQCADLEASE